MEKDISSQPIICNPVPQPSPATRDSLSTPPPEPRVVPRNEVTGFWGQDRNAVGHEIKYVLYPETPEQRDQPDSGYSSLQRTPFKAVSLMTPKQPSLLESALPIDETTFKARTEIDFSILNFLEPVPALAALAANRGFKHSNAAPYGSGNGNVDTSLNSHFVYLDDAPNCLKTGSHNKAPRPASDGFSSDEQQLIDVGLDPDEDGLTSSTSLDTEVSSDDAQGRGQSASPQNLHHILTIRAKFELIRRLMRSVYVLFNSNWQTNIHQCSPHDTSASNRDRFDSEKPTSTRFHKCNKRQRRDETPPGDNERDKRHKSKHRVSEKGYILKFACPFNKYDCEKYRPTTESGNRYRSCTGPGFKTISHVKQHLQRVHRCIQCVRCWSIFKTPQELADHVNDQLRCERRIQQPEGLDQSKMDHISSKFGATWEGIYEIIFPGAPIPSPYWEPYIIPEQPSIPSTPRSGRQLDDFESYTRRFLPQLVEAHLSSCISADMAPIEEKLKALVGDTIRKCQAQLFENYQRRASDSPSGSSGSTRSSINSAVYQRPPSVDVEPLANLAPIPFAIDGSHRSSQRTDSAYDSGEAALTDCGLQPASMDREMDMALGSGPETPSPFRNRGMPPPSILNMNSEQWEPLQSTINLDLTEPIADFDENFAFDYGPWSSFDTLLNATEENPSFPI